MSLLKNELPLVSVVIACFNHEKYIQECILSVLAQDYVNIELIIIDDGSIDDSVEKISELVSVCQERFVRFEFRSRSNIGLSATLNEALEWCVGAYFSPTASDDVLLSNKVSSLVGYLTADELISVAFGSVKIINQNSEITSVRRLGERLYSFADVFLLKGSLPAAASMLRMDVIKDIGGFNVDSKIEDWDLWLRITESDRLIKTFSDFVVLYRQHGANFSSQVSVMHDEINNIALRYKGHRLYGSFVSVLKCVMFRDYARVDKVKALKILPDVFFMVGDVRLYQGLFYLLFKW